MPEIVTFSRESAMRIKRALRRLEHIPRNEGGRLGNGPRFTGNSFFPVKVTQTGGSAGDDTTPCSFTYTVKSLDGETLKTGASPVLRRTSVGAYSAPSADTYGQAFWDENGDVQLYDANEVPLVEVCP